MIIATVLIVCLFLVMFERLQMTDQRLRFIAIITAAAIVGRLLFSSLPNIQPATAIVLLVAVFVHPIAGAISGMLVVVLTSLFLGSGPFVLFQALAYATIASLGFVPFLRYRIVLTGYGFLAGFLYGWVSNLGFLVLTGFSWQAFLTLLVAGGTFDMLHGFSNAIFIWILFPIFLRIMHSFDEKRGTE
ncbi:MULTISPECIES: ECF transporter S component [unclassified Exiguobacterium]|uniref:ECF transporter S component n=1 Tax=unclassified Exiguobacterium TaxID=2644629 RepID=UPI0025BBE483|nr:MULTISPECIES: ECF transporter S component [unclassified Exiguobacterium]